MTGILSNLAVNMLLCFGIASIIINPVLVGIAYTSHERVFWGNVGLFVSGVMSVVAAIVLKVVFL